MLEPMNRLTPEDESAVEFFLEAYLTVEWDRDASIEGIASLFSRQEPKRVAATREAFERVIALEEADVEHHLNALGNDIDPSARGLTYRAFAEQIAAGLAAG
jgi:hypothetical protein